MNQEPVTKIRVEERELGLDRSITRRDFINGATLGAGSALLGVPAPGSLSALEPSAQSVASPSWDPWTGYGGVGDYAVSNGNTWEVVSAGHGIRDGLYKSAIDSATPTGETYDLVIAGGGFAGVISAYTFLKNTGRKRQCLLLDNHRLIGGEAKRNEFMVGGQRLIGPQGSNDFVVPTSSWRSELWRDVGLPTEFEFGTLPKHRRAMEFPRTSYDHIFWDYFSPEHRENNGYYFDSPHPHWVRNPWAHGLAGTPWSADLRRDLLRWRDEAVQPYQGDQASLERWLDTMSYQDYLLQFRKFHPQVARYVDPWVASVLGPASDGVSAYAAYFCTWPGFKGLGEAMATQFRDWKGNFDESPKSSGSFPGGNDGIMRAILKWLNPDLIEGTTSFPDIHRGHIRVEAMDRAGEPCRMRAGATVVRVVHDPEDRRKSGRATVIYARNGKLFSVQARTVIWAGASWSGQHAIQNLPDDYRTAMRSFGRSPMLVANVALNNWRALYKLGYTSCSWRGGFGYTVNIRAPMCIGDERPSLDPDQPVILTFYVPFPQPGIAPLDQGKVARAKLYATSYRDFELQIRQQLTKLFGNAGFDAKRDIAGIVLNRWGHAYVNAGPGFYFGRDGKPAPRDVLCQPLGNLVFAHSELNGLQSWDLAGAEAVRATRQILTML